MKKFLSSIAIVAAVPILIAVSAAASERPVSPSFLEAKTFFQTNLPYDPRIALAVDAVVVHRHGEKAEPLARNLSSWKERGYTVGRMFFSDSDAGNFYWKGRWDGKPHPDDVERNARGDVVQCAGVRPYMVPTDGWIRYLEEMARISIDAGAQAVLPEEPLAHADTGYEKSFQELWAKRYGRPWEPESASRSARFLTAQLKNELYLELIRRLSETVRSRARELGREIPFILPVHGLPSNVAAKLVAPLGTSFDVDGIDGYVGQVWTGPVNWALAHYDSKEKSFFASAYVLYDSFAALVRGSGRRLWLLSDPVEDDPKHEWAEFETWYRHCVAAMLLFPECGRFEVMPWPDRIFLPGYGTGGGTPAPEPYRIAILSAVQALQEVPAAAERSGGESAAGGAAGAAVPADGIGVALSDTVLWEKEPFPPLQGLYGLTIPLVLAGVPVSACYAERFGDPGYLSRFRAIVLSYEFWKPLDARVNEALAAWVKKGGSLILLGSSDDLGSKEFWWWKLGCYSPLVHLLSLLGMEAGEMGERQAGAGRVFRLTISPRSFADPDLARSEYFPLLDRALRRAGSKGLETPGRFLLRRGPFAVAHAGTAAFSVPGKLIDVFDPALSLLDGARLEPGSSGLYRDVSGIVDGGPGGGGVPCVLHGTHRVSGSRWEGGVLKVLVRGPAGTPAVLRIYRAGRTAESVAARGSDGKSLDLESREEGPTLWVRFPNDPAGASVEISWKG